MHILKFGGTSMVDEDSWRRVLDIIMQKPNPIVVVSATARTTRQLATAAETARNNLVKAKNIGKEIKQRHSALVHNFLALEDVDHQQAIEQACLQWVEKCISTLDKQLENIAASQKLMAPQKDAILSIGEQLSAFLFAKCGEAYGLNMEWTDARSIIKTDDNFGSAHPYFNKIYHQAKHLKNDIDNHIIPVIGGFYGESEDGKITTLGFEGSDYSAGLIGAALRAKAIEIWTDVSGIFSCDPRTVASAKPIDQLSFNDAAQLAHHGAKVLHPSTMKPASSKNIPVFVKNIFEPQAKGTEINKYATGNGAATAIAYIKNAVVLNISTINQSIHEHRMIEVFAILEEYEADTVALQTKKKLTIVILKNAKRANELEAKLSKVSTVTKIENQAVIGLIGCKSENFKELGSLIKQALSLNSSSLLCNNNKGVINIVLSQERLTSAVKKLHKSIFES